MNTLFLGVAATLVILTSTFSQAASVLVPSFKGKINNYTSLSNNEIQVFVWLDCTYKSGVIWPQTKSCGSVTHQIPVQADGTFVVPNLNWQQKNNIKNYRISLAVNQINSSAMRSITSGALYQKDVKLASQRFAEISIYEMPALKVNVATPTGEDYASWRGMIKHPSKSVKDPCVELIFRVSLERPYSLGEFTDIVESGTDTKVAGAIPSVYFGTQGNPGQDLQVQASLYYRSSKPACQVNQNKTHFDKAIDYKGSLSDIHKYFNNSTYKVD